MDNEPIASLLFTLAFGLLWLAIGLRLRRGRRRLLERGVRVTSFATGRSDSGSQYSAPRYEVQFTGPTGERMTTWSGSPASSQTLVYDPERPPIVKRLGPIRHMRHRPMPEGSLNSKWRRAFEGFLLFVALFSFVIGIVDFVSPARRLAFDLPYTVSPLDADAEAAARDQFRTGVHTATADGDQLFRIRDVEQVARAEQPIGYVVLAAPRRSGLELAGERRDINGTAVTFASHERTAMVRLGNRFVFIFGIDAVSTREIAEAVVSANP